MKIEATLDYNRGVKLLEAKKYDKAIASFKKSIAKFPSKEAYLNIATSYRGIGLDTSCYDSLMLANSKDVPFLSGEFINDDYVLAISNLGLYYYSLGFNDLAIAHYRRALDLKPDYFSCAWNLSCALLRADSYSEEGWTLYDERFRKDNPITLKYTNPRVQLWDGSHVPSILVYAEQGYGDNLMFARYLRGVAKFCDKLYVQCSDDIAPLFSEYNTILDCSELDATHAVPIASLAHLFGKVPGNWLAGKYDAMELAGEFKIGIVWAGSPGHANDMNRSTNMHRFHPLTKYGTLYCLTPGFKGTKHINALDINSWEDTCEAIEAMDLIITVDTSVAHLAGCLGKECWMLQPLKDTDFRWGLDSMGSKNDWYDSVKVFRNPNSWDVVFKQVIEEVKDRVYG